MLPKTASPHTDRLWEIFPWVVYKSTLLKYLMQMKCIVFQASGVKLTLDDTQGYKPIMCNRCFKFKYVSTIGRFKKNPRTHVFVLTFSPSRRLFLFFFVAVLIGTFISPLPSQSCPRRRAVQS